MPPTTSREIKSDAKAYGKAWDEPAKKFESCKACKTPGYCAQQGCQAKAAEVLKKAEG